MVHINHHGLLQVAVAFPGVIVTVPD